MRAKQRLKVLSLALPAAALAIAVYSPDASAAPPERLSPGTYATAITPEDIPASFPPEAIPLLSGYWELQFAENGTALARKDGETVVTASYIATPGHLVFHDEGGTLACTEPGTATGVYALMIDGDQVTAKAVHDGCAGRALVMTAHPLLRLE
jgi:hypothetical protein